MVDIINNVKKAFNWASIQATGLNGNSFSEGKIDKMQEIADIYANATNSNILLTDENKQNIVSKIKELGKSVKSSKSFFLPQNNCPVSTRSAVVMAVFIAYIASNNQRISTSIAELNSTLKNYLSIEEDLIQDNSDTNRYLKEATAFINNGCKSISSHGDTPEGKLRLHEIFKDMGGTHKISDTFDKPPISLRDLDDPNWLLRLPTRTENYLLTTQRQLNESLQKEGEQEIKIDPKLFVITLYKNLIYYNDVGGIVRLFKQLDSETKTAIVILVYKHNEYNFLATKYKFFDNLNPEEKNKVQKELCKNAIHRKNSRHQIQEELINKADATYNEGICQNFINQLSNPIKDYNDLKSKLGDFNIYEQAGLTIHDVAKYLFDSVV